jgi:hypothetical protein
MTDPVLSVDAALARPAVTESPEGGPSGDAARDRLAKVEWWLVGLALALHLFALRHVVYGDAGTRFDTLQMLVEQGKLSDARFSIVQSLLALPFYLIGRVVSDPVTGCAYFNVVIFWLTLAAVFRQLRGHVEPASLRRLLLLLSTASMFGHHLQTFYSETLGACCALLGIVYLACNRPILAGVAMVVGTVNAPQTAIALVACNAAWALWTRRFGQALWPLLVSALLWVTEMIVRRGWPLHTAYENTASFVTLLPYSGKPGFSYPIALGLLSLLFSFGKGVVLFAPGLLLHHVRAGRDPEAPAARVATLSMLYAWGLLLVFAKWWSWYGGWFWGPRFLLFASIPASLALARHLSAPSASIAKRALVLAVLVWSLWVGVNGVVYGQYAMDLCQMHSFQLEFLCWYVPEFSALFRPFIVARPLGPRELFVMAHALVVTLVLGAPLVTALASDTYRAIQMRLHAGGGLDPGAS